MAGSDAISHQKGLELKVVLKLTSPISDYFCRTSSHDSVRFDILGHHSSSRYNGALSNSDPGENQSPIANPYVVADHYIAATSCKVRGLGIMTQSENGGFRPNGNIIPSDNLIPPAVEHTPKIDHIPLAKVDLAAVKKAATHLDGASLTETAKITP